MKLRVRFLSSFIVEQEKKNTNSNQNVEMGKKITDMIFFRYFPAVKMSWT